ncbi:MAG TPA: hypothetical protein PLM79_10850 [Syntrophobacteraceae bacterium]|nr:hypothetical protein [Syntrophobacteraceae bacterium]
MTARTEESSQYRRPMEDEEWRSVVLELRRGLARLDSRQVQARVLGIRQGLNCLDAMMSRYCELTCGSCPDRCCHGKNIFYNRADLLFLASSGLDLPPGQTRARHGEPCRYLGERGCDLDRARRPYVCVWFLCEPQVKLFRQEPPHFQRQALKWMESIRRSRLEIESLFERASRKDGR